MLFLIFIVTLADQPPRALVELEQARSRIRHADITWERTDYRNSFVPGVAKSYRSAYSEHEVAYFADGTIGDDTTPPGITGWTADGDPVLESRYAHLTTATARWALETDHLTGTKWDDPRPDDRDQDVRLIGMMPQPILDADPATLLSRLGEGHRREYHETIIDGLHVVECAFPGDQSKYVWYIDPAKGWNCVRSQAIVNGAVIAESVADYQSADGKVWFPTAVDYFGSSMEPLVHIEVSSAKINTPDLPKTLTPEFIGFGSCMQVIHVAPDGKTGDIMKYVADGRLATLSEYSQLLADGKTTVDPRIVEFDKKHKEISAAQRSSEEALERAAKAKLTAIPADEWEAYTRDFINRFRLDTDQSQKAMLILLQCQQRRDAYLKSRERDFADLGRRLVLASDKEKTTVKERIEILRRPVEEIFERQLKPRLDKLPTRKQRDAVEHPATQPGTDAKP